MNSLCFIVSPFNTATPISPITPSSGNSVFGIANCIFRLDATDTANISLGPANAVIYWKSSSTYANVYMKTGQSGATANGFPTYYTGTYPYVYFNNGGSSTNSSTTQGLQANTSMTGWKPYAQNSYYVVFTTTADLTGYHAVLRLSSVSTYPGTFMAIQPTTSGTKTFAQIYRDTSANNFFNFEINYTTNIPVGTRLLISFTNAYNQGLYAYYNGSTLFSNTSTFTPLNTLQVIYQNISVGGGYDGRAWTGYLNEVLWYGDYHDTNTRRSIEANLVSKWAITGYT